MGAFDGMNLYQNVYGETQQEETPVSNNLRWTEKVGDVWYGMTGNQIRAIFYFVEDAEEWRTK